MIPKICSFNIKILNISCGFNHSALLSYSGYLYTMGSNEYGKLGIGIDKTPKKNIPCLVHELQDYFITNVSCGWYHTAAVSDEGKLFTWGRGKHGVLGIGSDENYPFPQEVTFFEETNEKIDSVSCGMCHMGVVSTNAKLFLWGSNEFGQLGNSSVKDCTFIPCENEIDRKYIEVACGLTHTLTLTTEGLIYAAGDNDEGQCGLGKKDLNVFEFELVEGLADVQITKVVAGCHSAAITSDEDIYVWGTSTFGQFLAPEKSVSLSGVIDASIGRSSGAAVDRSGKVWTWGYNELGQLGQIDIEPRCIPTLVKPIKKKKVFSVAVGSAHVIAIGENKFINSKANKDEKRTKSIEPSMKSTNDGIETHKGIEFKTHNQVYKENPSKSVERINSQNPIMFDFKDAPKPDNKDRFEVNVNRFTLGINQENKSNEDIDEYKARESEKYCDDNKDDLVDVISEAAKKLMKDPNSYYFNLKKDDKSKPSTPVNKNDMEKQIPSEASTPDIGITKVNKNVQLNGNSAPIEPFCRNKVPENSKEIKHNQDIAKSSIKEEKQQPRVSISEVLKSRPKKVVKEEPKIPMPKYEPLPCMECSNIQSICESLGISKIDEVVELVNSLKHENELKLFKDENQKLHQEIRQLKKTYDEKECKFLIDNEKLKLENSDLLNSKQRITKSKDEIEKQYDKLRLEFKVLQEESKKQKYNYQQLETLKKHEVEELQKDNKILKEQLERYKSETENFRNVLNDRTKNAITKDVEKLKKDEELMEQKRRKVHELMNYKLTPDANGSGTAFDYADRYGSKFTAADGEDNSHLETPSRSLYPPSSEEAFLKSVKRNFVRLQAPVESTNDEGTKSKNSGDRDRNVYTGFNADDSQSESGEIEISNYQKKIMMSIERRVGGYEPVFCKLDTNQYDQPIYQTPQVRFRNFVDAKKCNSLEENRDNASKEKFEAKEKNEAKENNLL